MVNYYADNKVFDKIIRMIQRRRPHDKIQMEWIKLPEKYKIDLVPEYDFDRYLNLWMFHYLSFEIEYDQPVYEYGRHPEITDSDMKKHRVCSVIEVLKGWPLTISALFDNNKETWTYKKLCKELKINPKNRAELWDKLYRKNSLVSYYPAGQDEFVLADFFKVKLWDDEDDPEFTEDED